MDSKTMAGQEVQGEGNATLSNSGVHQGTLRLARDETTPRYQVILRHLAKFRDGARALLDVFGEPASAAAAAPSAGKSPPMSKAPASAEKTAVPMPEPKGPLQVRIERHMGGSRSGPRADSRSEPRWQEESRALTRAARGDHQTRANHSRHRVGRAHFWSASIQNSPLDNFDETERAWIARIVRLAKIQGVDADYQGYLDFLSDWASQEHS